MADHVGTEQQHRDALIRWDPEKYKRVHALTHAAAQTQGGAARPPVLPDSPVVAGSMPVEHAHRSRANGKVADYDPTTPGQSTLIETVCQPEAPSGAGGALVSVWTCPSESVARTARLW